MSQALQIGQYTTNASAEATIVPLKSVILVSTLPLSESSFRALSSCLPGLLIHRLTPSCLFKSLIMIILGKPPIRQSVIDGPSSLALLPRPSHSNTDERSSFILAHNSRFRTRIKIRARTRTRTNEDDDDLDGFDDGIDNGDTRDWDVPSGGRSFGSSGEH
jgi:hypothetical protein